MKVRLPLRDAAIVGINLTLMVQEEAAGKTGGQLFVSEKSPDAVIALRLRLWLPLLKSVTACCALEAPRVVGGKLRLCGLIVAIAPDPAPLRLMVWGEPAASSAMASIPARGPAAVGVKVIDNKQLPVAGTLGVQLSVSAKSPVIVIEPMVN